VAVRARVLTCTGDTVYEQRWRRDATRKAYEEALDLHEQAAGTGGGWSF
jgi:23S rRNA maturation mini-RNase III